VGRRVKTFLLDANVLLALAWPNHPFHNRAAARLAQRTRYRWATCLLTQAAFVRLSSNPSVVPNAKSPIEAGEMLKALLDHPAHIFLDAKRGRLPKLLELLKRCHGHNQVNDAFLIWVAVSCGARLLTFDAPLQHLAPAQELVEVIS
jgi:toxin-antitoxin system PIN domain toxin